MRATLGQALAKRLARFVEHMQHTLLAKEFLIAVCGLIHTIGINEKRVVVDIVDMLAFELQFWP